MIGLVLLTALAFAGDTPFPVARVRADAEPVHPLLDAWLRQECAIPRGRGGRRTQAGTASPGPGGTWLTVHHVVAGAREVTLEIDGMVHTADVVAVSTEHDVALLRAPSPAPAIPTGRPVEGMAAFAPGFSGDGPQTRIEGTLGPQVEIPFPGRPTAALRRWSAPVRRGHSGAPVLVDGARVGMVIAGSEPASALKGDGLFLPFPRLDGIVARMVDIDRDRRIGMRVTATADGVVVAAVTPDSPAQQAGLQAGDRFTGSSRPAALAEDVAIGSVRWTVHRGAELVEIRARVP